MESKDMRFKNALGEFVQHFINNPEDYSINYVFQERLNLLDNDEKFNAFIETILIYKA
ncbi:MAG: hypothetical protein EZS26_001853 [Candidatus Ordinivivax streblomastigis]|jgi:hypothetical protein|uniref:AbiJ-NTD3 domain-containing protein n=1 Tax=Candidatus Ordinivivax streblomastigis TaxID=2540710 RepID=A0A5M8P0S1_9BACT|nr:MAG: hypothetical protein EZS26_001853 [Candidatus Ordinivivax streblomastigis]